MWVYNWFSGWLWIMPLLMLAMMVGCLLLMFRARRGGGGCCCGEHRHRDLVPEERPNGR